MPIIRLTVEQTFVDYINQSLKEINSDRVYMAMNIHQIAREALAVYKWFVEQTAHGYAVVSVNRDLTELVQVCTPHVPAKEPRI